ncbi:hypothetical protein [Caldalkalibacillus mannanilyticus]|uniref:hypothetical protein n=1 Tax=Caldalkalibacillus mannanilyticus TaxID=1418 RepID=UPI000468DD1E|nr:hypothetical protein [Caldalkalibacillus mannanilyticus]
MRRNMMSSLFAIGGIALAVMQMMRMRNRNTPWSSMVHRMNHTGQDMLRGVNNMMRMVRRRVRA